MRKPDWSTADGSIRLWNADALAVLPELETASIDAVITDPPYSSGGAFRGDRTQKTVSKYVQTTSIDTCRTEFTGDNRDQRSFLAWCSLWLAACHAACVDGAVLCCFSDWRQVPVLTDALQCGGFVWRNLATWWKPGVRMQRGRFSSSSEFILYGSRGVPRDGECSPQNVYPFQPVDGEDKVHVAEKPVEVLKWLLGVTVPGAVVLDPFMGSGAIAEACIQTGRCYVGIEIDDGHFDRAVSRIEAEINRHPLWEPPPLVQRELVQTE